MSKSDEAFERWLRQTIAAWGGGQVDYETTARNAWNAAIACQKEQDLAAVKATEDKPFAMPASEFTDGFVDGYQMACDEMARRIKES